MTTAMDDLEERQGLVESVFKDNDVMLEGELTAPVLQAIHAEMRLGGISIPQVQASVGYVCLGKSCEMSELYDLLQEMDRRYFLIQDLRWEFSMLDTLGRDAITEEQAKWLVQAVHGEFFLNLQWEKFVRSRTVPGSGVSFAEIEVMLCNVPSIHAWEEEQREEELKRLERDRKQAELDKQLEIEKERRRKQREKEKLRKLEADKKKKGEEDARRKEEEEERLRRQREKEEEERRRKQLEEDEERGRREEEERLLREKRKREEEEKRRQEEEANDLAEQRRLQELADRHRLEEEERLRREAEEAKSDEEILRKAIKDEKDTAVEIEEWVKKVKSAKDERTKKAAEEGEKSARLRNKEARITRIRYNLKVQVKKRNRELLPGAVEDFKKAKLPDTDGDLEKGEALLREFQAREGLKNAMDRRDLNALENAISYVKRNGFEVKMANELIEANKVLMQLRRLARIRAEILELKQSTVAEIRSYQKPPPIVHTVMTATFLILGHKEKETKDWKTVQALVGKTGKEGLKRRCLECEPPLVDPEAAARAKELLSEFGLDDVRDVSAGAATFYLWTTTMIEELEIRLALPKEEQERLRKEEEAARKAKDKPATPASRATSRSPARSRAPSKSPGPVRRKPKNT